MKENIGIKGRFRIEKVTPTGDMDFRDISNTIVTVGKASAANRITSGTGLPITTPFNWIALGLGSSTITAGDTTLGSEYLRYGLGSITGSTTTTTTTNDTARFIGSFGIDAVKSINEAGLFNASGVDLGSMFARTTFADLATISGDRVNVTWDIVFS